MAVIIIVDVSEAHVLEALTAHQAMVQSLHHQLVTQAVAQAVDRIARKKPMHLPAAADRAQDRLQSPKALAVDNHQHGVTHD